MRIIALTLAICCLPLSSFAQKIVWPVEEGGNGHCYEIICEDPSIALTWQQARSFAEDRGGYLATVTSAEEDRWVHAVYFDHEPQRAYGPYIGGYQDTSAADFVEPDGGWRWITGEQWEYEGWCNHEPNNLAGAGSENYLHYQSGECWNDIRNYPVSVYMYIIEYDYHGDCVQLDILPIVPETCIDVYYPVTSTSITWSVLKSSYR